MGERCLLATLVKVEGSSYREVGARMLMTSGGGRTGTISGGCLEAEIQKKAWWRTEQGAVIQQYRTSSEFTEIPGPDTPFGLGCNGTLHILLKRVGEEDAAWLDRLEKLHAVRENVALATALSGPCLGKQWLFPVQETNPHAGLLPEAAWNSMQRVAAESTMEYLRLEGEEFLVEALPPRQKLVIFGAGDDSKPLVRFARLLGWDITVADGRSHLATVARFPEAAHVVSAPATELPLRCAVRADDAVVIMTHSFEQDRELLGALQAQPLRYLGQLGPRRRTKELLASISSEFRPSLTERLHAPIGLDIGAHTPETIALAIIAEVQFVLSKLHRAAMAKTQKSELDVVPDFYEGAVDRLRI